MSLICWWCVHELPQLPCIHLPIKYDEKKNIFTTKGNFCSWQCAKAYAIDMATARAGEIQMLIMTMRRHAYGKYVPLWPAPKREALACFGGTMSIEEFRSYGGTVEPPQVHFPYEKIYVPMIGSDNSTRGIVGTVSSTSDGAGRLKAIENATSETDTLRLKRTKPLVRSASKLENALGLKRMVKEKA